MRAWPNNQYITNATMANNYLAFFMQNYGLQHIAIKVLTYLDFKNLQNSRLVSKEWKQFIDESKPIWISKLRSLKFGIMKNYFEIIRLNDILDINSRLHICLKKNVNIEFLSAYPEWKKTIEHFETRSFPEIYTFWKHMNRYFKIDWNAEEMKQMIIDNREFIRPCSPASYAVLTKNTAFLEAIFKGPFELSVKNEQGDNVLLVY